MTIEKVKTSSPDYGRGGYCDQYSSKSINICGKETIESSSKWVSPPLNDQNIYQQNNMTPTTKETAMRSQEETRAPMVQWLIQPMTF